MELQSESARLKIDNDIWPDRTISPQISPPRRLHPIIIGRFLLQFFQYNMSIYSVSKNAEYVNPSNYRGIESNISSSVVNAGVASN